MTTWTTLREAGTPVLVSPAEVAPVGLRLVALAVDQLLVAVCWLAITAVWLPVGGPGRGLLVVWLVTGLLVEGGQAFVEAVTGATLGGALVRVRTVSARTGWPAGLIAVVVRRLVVAAAGVMLPVVGAYVMAGSGVWNPSPTRRGGHDWAADTLVLRDWAVPDQAERSAERTRRQAARDATDLGAGRRSGVPTVPSSDEASADGKVRPAALTERAPTAAEPGVGPEPTAEPEPAARLRSAAEPEAADLGAADPESAGAEPVAERPSAAGPESAVEVEPGDGRVLFAGAGHGWPDRDNALDLVSAEPASTSELAQDLTRVVPIVVPDLVPEPVMAHPPARHRATVLGLGRQRPWVPSGRHRVVEVPTQRTAPRLPDAWPRFLDSPEPVQPSADDAAQDGLRLVFDSGVSVEVVGNGVVGRDLSGVLPPPAHPVVVDDPKRTVSRVHLQFGPEAGRQALWVMDENSTNGTVLVRPDGAARVLPAGVRTVIGVGWQVRFGERAAVVEAAVTRRPAVRVALDVAAV